MTEEEYRQWVKNQIMDESRFIKAVFSGRRHGHSQRWRRVVVRPVLIRSKHHLQFSYFDERQDVSKNYTADEIPDKLDEILALPFSHLTLQTTERETQARFSKKGKIFMQDKEVGQPRPLPSKTHDHQKDLLLSVENAADFLQAIGILNPDGKIKAVMRRKYRQINEFLRLIIETNAVEEIAHTPITIVDCGCGSAHLTFAVYYYLTTVMHIPSRVTGVDLKKELLEQQAQLAGKLGWEGVAFHHSTIIDFVPEVPPDIVLALHACDTATDEALAQAIRWRSAMIFSAPCCHHHLQEQLGQAAIPQVFNPVVRHGILKERLGDVLTDSFRAQLMRVMGYRTEVVEFISAEHTDKNLMIRGVKTSPLGDPKTIEEYRDLKAYWHVQPYLESLLADELSKHNVSLDM